MASELEPLDDLRFRSGIDLLQKIDDLAFEPVIAGWILHLETHRWQYLLVTSMIDSRGPDWVYRRLLQALMRVKLPDGITPLDIHISSAQEVRFHDFHFGYTGPFEGALRISGMTVGRWAIEQAVLYRSIPPDGRVSDASNRFDARVKAVMAA